ncbi:OsmC family protein [Cupriavidus necator]|uniref:OsmC family protein n=1 Tax=Cupriavidus necator TaxID=106590 RepID=UPI00339D9917
MTIQATWQPSQGNTICHLSNGTAEWQADLDAAAGGDTKYPSPHDLLDSALAACTTLTLQLYARRKDYPITGIHVCVAHEEANGTYTIKREVKIAGEVAPDVLNDLLRVANRCPVHKTLSGQFSIQTSIG